MCVSPLHYSSSEEFYRHFFLLLLFFVLQNLDPNTPDNAHAFGIFMHIDAGAMQ
jgi:hypothetical protein